MRVLLYTTLILLITIMGACSPFNITNKHINKKYKKAKISLQHKILSSTDVEYWDNQQKDKPAFVIVRGFGVQTKYE